MTTPETPQPPRPAEEVPLVTIVPNLNAFEISGLAEEPDKRIHTWNKPDIAQEAGEKLSRLYAALGQGAFMLEEVKAATQLGGQVITSAGAQLANALPEELFKVEGKGKKRTLIFGQFKIASRMASVEEVEAFAADMEAKAEKAYADHKEAVNAAEEHKTDMTTVDHALIRTREKTFYLPVTTVGAVVAVRAFEALKTLHGTFKYMHQVPYSELHKLMWDSMTLAERQLFTDSEKQLYGNGTALGKTTEQIISSVMSPLGIARRDREMNQLVLGNNPDFTINIMAEPPEEPYNPDTVTPIFPPGTAKVTLYASNLGEVAPEEVNALTATLQRLLEIPHLTHDDAINVLDIVTNARTKSLARRVLNQLNVTNAEATLEHLDRRSQAALGQGRYYYARRERTIGGTKITASARIQQVSRNLPGRTFRHINEGDRRRVTTKWHFGRRES